MSGNTFGKIFSVTTFGESHGEAMGCIIDGCPPNFEIKNEDIQMELDRRKPGQSDVTTQRKEDDKVEIMSGVFEGKTLGTPIALLIKNEDQISKDYSNIKDTFRPNHADLTYQGKYGIRDYRGGGRSSARETAMRVAAGAVAKKYLNTHGIITKGFVSQVGSISADTVDLEFVNKNKFFFPDRSKMVVTENKKYSEDYLDPEKRSIANKLRVLFKDGSSTQEIEVEYPIGHRRRRNEGIPVLEKKFLSNLKTVFDDDKSEQIYKEFLDFDKLTSMSVVDFQKLLSL